MANQDASTTTSRGPDPTLTGADMLRAAEELVPLLSERAAEVDETRIIHQDTYERLAAGGFLHTLRPRKYDGLELDDHVNALMITTLAQGCASTAWVTTVLGAGSLLILGFPEEVHDEVWGPDTNASLAGNVNINPKAKVERVSGGYKLSGQWGFCSGSDFSTWLIAAAPIGDEGPHFFLVEQDLATPIDDWYVTGLRGTNSRTMVFDDAFVPDRRVLPMMQFAANLNERREQFPTFDNLYNPFPSPGRFSFSSVALGSAIGAANHFAENLGSATRVATGMGGISKLAEQEYIGTEFAEISGELAMAMALVERRSLQASERAARHELPSPRESAEATRDSALVARLSMRNISRLFSLVGSKAGMASHPVSRAKRDIEMASSHVGNNWRNAAVGYMANLTQD